MRLEDIGFYTLSDERAAKSNEHTPLMRCELLVTDRCNFNCPYCRSDHTGEDISWPEAKEVLDFWISQGLENVRLSGGEPTLWPWIIDAVSYLNAAGVERIAISTNGSARTELYELLIAAGVSDLSISLDSCCSATGEHMAGVKDRWHTVVENIAFLSRLTYVTVGIVLTDYSVSEVIETVALAHSLGVNDVRIIPAAQNGKTMRIPVSELAKYADGRPILKYRLTNLALGRDFRGLDEDDSNRCHLVCDDMAVENGMHYPCIIYLREGGDPIGSMQDDVRAQRGQWAREHDTHADPICSTNCLDVCVDFNNTARRLNPAAREG